MRLIGPGIAVAVLTAFAGLGGGRLFAVSTSSVLVLYNGSSPDGSEIASYYSQKHPGVQTLALTGLPTAEQVTWDIYLNQIRPQVLGALTSSIDIIVTTKGLPLRIYNPKPSPFAFAWKEYSSLESELTRIDTINSRDLMGNQGWQYNPPTGNPLAANPYYYADAPFSHQTYGTRLAARLDGYSAADVEGAIDRAARAVLRPGYQFIVDDDPNAPAANTDHMPQLAANVLAPRNLAYTYDNTTTFITNTPAGPPRRVLGYDSHGVYGGGAPATPADPRSYIQTQLAFQRAPGAVFQSWESYNAYSFTEGANKAGQGLLAEWLKTGGTAAVGNVEEPYVDIANVTNEDRLFEMLLRGYTWAEAAWNATRQLSYVNTIVGDPLMVFRPWVEGDVDLDGLVNLYDLTRVKAAYGSAAGDTRYDFFADMDADGKVDLYDLAYVKARYMKTASGTLAGPASAGGVLAEESPDSLLGLSAAPEPASLALLTVGVGAILALRHRRRTAAARQGFPSRSTPHRLSEPGT